MVARHEHSAAGNVDIEGAPSIIERPHPLSMVYGGGGVFGIGYGAGVAQGLARSGIAVASAASSAVPGLFPPHRIDGRLYMDGGMWSATSVDAAADAEQVIVVAPLAGPVMGPLGRTAGFLLARELQAWRSRHPGATITMIRPDRAIARLAGRNPLALFDADRARQVYPLAVEQGLRWGECLQSDTAA